MSLRGSSGSKPGQRGKAYPALPRWSISASDDPDDTHHSTAIAPADDNRSTDSENALRASAVADLCSLTGLDGEPGVLLGDLPIVESVRRKAPSSTSSDGTDSMYATAKGDQVSATARDITSTLKGDKRTSIWFDATAPNPLLQPPSPDSTISDESPRSLESQADLELELSQPQLALSLHAFVGESAFGELSFARGCDLCIEVEDLGGGWSLGYPAAEGEGGRGLIPRGFYALIAIENQGESETTPSDAPILVDSSSNLEQTTAAGAATRSNKSETSAEPSAGSTEGLHESTTSDQALRDHRRLVADSQRHVSAEDALDFGSRSLPRSVVVSGVIFEPAIPTPPIPVPPPLPLPPQSYFDRQDGDDVVYDWRKEFGVGEDIQTPSAEELDEFFKADRTRQSVEFDEAMGSSLEAAVLQASCVDEELMDDEQEQRERRWTLAVEEADKRASGVNDEAAEAMPDEHSRVDQDGAAHRDTLNTGTFQSPSAIVSAGSLLTTQVGLNTTFNAFPTAAAARKKPARHASSTVKGDVTLAAIYEWIHAGEQSSEPQDAAAAFHIESGPAWRGDSPSFQVRIAGPELQTNAGGRDYWSFTLSTSVLEDARPCDFDMSSGQPMSVSRRYSDFVALNSLLKLSYPIIVIPDLPSKLCGPEMETRRRDLERWCDRLGRHPVLRSSELLRSFLTTESEKDLRALLHPVELPMPTSFFANVFHPDFNIDTSDAQDLVAAFERHCRAIELGEGVKKVEDAMKGAREALLVSSSAGRQLAVSLCRLVSGSVPPPTSSDAAHLTADEVEAIRHARDSKVDQTRARAWKLQNIDGACSPMDADSPSLGITKAVQAAAHSIDSAASETEQEARYELLSVQELLREMTYPLAQHQFLIQAHRFALAEHATLCFESASPEVEDEVDEEALARCETVLNITSAEIHRALAERREDLLRIAELYLEADIAQHEQSLHHLRFAKSHFSSTALANLALTGPRLPNTIDLSSSRTAAPLVMPSNYGVPSSRIPSSAVVGEALGSVIGGLGLARRASAPVTGRGESRRIGAGGRGRMTGRSANPREDTHGDTDLLRLDEATPLTAGSATWRETFFDSVRLW